MVEIQDGAHLSNSIICENVIIKQGCRLQDGCLLGQFVVLKPEVELT